MFKRIVVSLFLIVGIATAQTRFGAGADQSRVEESTAPKAVSGQAVLSADLPIGPGDLLEIKVFEVPELSTSARVSNSGEITFPLLGKLTLAGMTVSAAEEMFVTRLKKDGVLVDPQVQITVAQYATQAISVLGQVRSPGSYNLLGSHTLMDAISAAGGLTPSAGATVTITHANNPQPVVLTLDTSPGQSWKTNPKVFPGDRIEVDRAPIVYVLGDVARPGGFVVNNRQPLTLVQVIALAEGTTNTAQSNIRLIRKNAAGNVEETRVSIKKVLSGKEADIALMDNDVIYVPSSATKKALHNTAELVHSTASAAIYRGW